MQLVFWHAAMDQKLDKYNTIDGIVIPYVVEDQIIIQLQALGLMAPGTKRRAVSDSQTYWKLTPYGEKYLLKVRAIKSERTEEDNGVAHQNDDA